MKISTITLLSLIIQLFAVNQSFENTFSASSSITGSVRYANSDSTVIRHASVILSDDQGLALDTSYTDATGSFIFTNLSSGNYKLIAAPIHPSGGINAVDALQILKHFTGFITLPEILLEAADVNGSGSVNSIDALLVQKRFVGLMPAFQIPDWISEQISISVDSLFTLQPVIHVICAGDVNASYIPNNNAFLFCGDTLVDDRDGKEYPTVQIGSQCWMQKNLDIGTILPWGSQPSNNGIIEKKCPWADQIYCDRWGALYQWNEIMEYQTTPGVKGICPEGFHIPTEEEWDSLIVFLGGYDVAGGKMKQTGTLNWYAPNVATNESGFTALGAGSETGVQFQQTLIWSSTEYQSGSDAYLCLIFNYSAMIELFPWMENWAFSVRCLKD